MKTMSEAEDEIMNHEISYKTQYGTMYHNRCEVILSTFNCDHPPVNLIFTSPPFPLNRAKSYGNMTGQEYLEWLKKLAVLFSSVLTEDGSVVIELGNAWEHGIPIQSTLPMEALLAFKNAGNFNLCQEFIHYNPARLPSPIEWVNKKRIRVKDSFTRIWWLSNSSSPKANNRNVLAQYSKQMKKLLVSGKYNSGKRPSEYDIGEKSFSVDNGGAIPSNVLIASNTVSNDPYLLYCKKHKLDIHPARMPKELPDFFIRFLTDEGDLVLDPFAGSNTTGQVAEELKRRWISIEAEQKYIDGSMGRFSDELFKR